MLVRFSKKHFSSFIAYKIKENEMDEVTKHDMMAMYYDRPNKEIILSMHFLNTSMEDEVF